MQIRLHSGAPENIDLKDTRLTPFIEEYPRKTPRNELSAVPKSDNRNNTLASSPP